MPDIMIGLNILWRGMLSMFVTMAVILCLTIVLTKVTAKKKPDSSQD